MISNEHMASWKKRLRALGCEVTIKPTVDSVPCYHIRLPDAPISPENLETIFTCILSFPDDGSLDREIHERNFVATMTKESNRRVCHEIQSNQ